MASTGTQTTYNGSFYLKIRWDLTSQSIANNSSGVRVRMYIGANSGWSIVDSTNSWTLSINGTEYSGSDESININGSEKLIADKQVYVDHNSNGTKSISINGSISGLYFGGINPGSFTATLDTIPRASSSSSSASWTATNGLTIGIQRADSSFTHTIRVYVGSTLVQTSTGVGTSVTIDSTTFHNNVVSAMGVSSSTSSRYEIDTISGGSKIGSTYSRTGTVTAPSSSSLTSVPNSFNVGSNLNTFGITREKSNFSHKVEMIHNGTSVISQTVLSANASVSLGSTSALYARMTTVNSANVVFRITTYYGDSQTTARQIRTPREYTSSAKIVNSNPSNPSLSYSISGYTAITGNTTNLIVQGKTSVSVTFGASSPVNSATIKSYTIKANGISDITGITSPTTRNIGVLNTSGNGTITVQAIDSRGNIGSTSTAITIIPYQKPALSAKVYRNDGFSDATTLNIKGIISDVKVANVRKNYIKSSRYRIKELPSGAWSTWTDLPSGTLGDTYTYTNTNGYTLDVPLELLNTKSYEFEVEVTDAFDGTAKTSETKNLILSSGQPLFWLDTDKNSVGINKFPDSNKSLEIGLEFGSASVYSKQSVVANNESTFQMNTLQDTSGGIQIFTRQDSSGWWDRKDGRTVIRYVPFGGNNLATDYDKGDLVIDPLTKLRIKANGEALRLSGSDHEYISFYNGSVRQGYMGQGSASSTEITLTAEKGNALIRSMATGGKVVLSAPEGVSSPTGSISGSLEHTSGYLRVGRFGASYGDGQAEMWYNALTRRMTMHSRNSGDTGANSLDVYASTFLTDELRANSTANHLILGVNSSKEVQVMQAGATSTYRPIRASSFPTGSSINYKTNLENVDIRVDALELIKETEIWHYHLKSNLEGGIFDKPKVGVIAEMVNPLIRDEDGIDTYSMVSLSWKAIQQLSDENDKLKTRIRDLERVLGVMIDEESNV